MMRPTSVEPVNAICTGQGARPRDEDAVAMVCEQFQPINQVITDTPRALRQHVARQHLVDVGVAHERRAGRGAIAREHVHDAGREARLADEAREVQARERRLLRELEHDTVAGRERGSELPNRLQGRAQRAPVGSARGPRERLLAAEPTATFISTCLCNPAP